MILPQRAISLFRCRQRLRRAGGGKRPGVDQLLAQLGILERRVDRRIELGDDAAGVRAGREQGVPIVDMGVGIAEFGEGRHVRQHRVACASGAERLELAAADLRQQHRQVGEPPRPVRRERQ